MRLLCRLHQSPQRVSALPRAPRRGWATCAGRSPGSRLGRSHQPSRRRLPEERGQWRLWQKLAAYSCGGSPGIALSPIERIGAHRIPIFTGQDLQPAGTFTRSMCSDQITAVKRGRPTPVAGKARISTGFSLKLFFGGAPRSEIRFGSCSVMPPDPKLYQLLRRNIFLK
jgi:hypothetical protein